ncbi:MAG: YHS domain-containing protein [Gammaproteobacteria bacterium]|nr:YHS domain-containing protein [Gammaproteobacteria bacterium]
MPHHSRDSLRGIAAAVFFALAAILSTAAFAADPPINVSRSTAGHAGGPAISGFDPVAYFTEAKPVPGDAKFSADYDGATWHFSSAENLARFEADPGKYAPQYGGYCAYAVSVGKTAPIDPAAWKIVDDKLYLNYNAAIQARWAQDIPKSIAAGDGNWPKVLE